MKTFYVIEKVRGIADVSPSEDHDYFIINRINVPSLYRGQGYGRQLLAQILADADAEHATLWLMPLGTTDPTGLTPWQLIAWYSRHGFILLESGCMVRIPKKEEDK